MRLQDILNLSVLIVSVTDPLASDTQAISNVLPVPPRGVGVGPCICTCRSVRVGLGLMDKTSKHQRSPFQ